MNKPQTSFDKIWRKHVVVDRGDGYHLLYIDRHLMHDGSAAGFARLGKRGQKLRRPDLSFATPDHYNSTAGRTAADIVDPQHRQLVEERAKEKGVAAPLGPRGNACERMKMRGMTG